MLWVMIVLLICVWPMTAWRHPGPYKTPASERCFMGLMFTALAIGLLVGLIAFPWGKLDLRADNPLNPIINTRSETIYVSAAGLDNGNGWYTTTNPEWRECNRYEVLWTSSPWESVHQPSDLHHLAVHITQETRADLLVQSLMFWPNVKSKTITDFKILWPVS